MVEFYPCPHETNGLDHSVQLPDYHPMSFDDLVEVISLVQANPGNTRLRAQVQVRINQAVPGHMCPRDIEGKAARKSAEIDQIYVSCLNWMGTEELALTIFDLING